MAITISRAFVPRSTTHCPSPFEISSASPRGLNRPTRESLGARACAAGGSRVGGRRRRALGQLGGAGDELCRRVGQRTEMHAAVFRVCVSRAVLRPRHLRASRRRQQRSVGSRRERSREQASVVPVAVVVGLLGLVLGVRDHSSVIGERVRRDHRLGNELLVRPSFDVDRANASPVRHAAEIIPGEEWILAVLHEYRTRGDLRERVVRLLSPRRRVHGEHDLRPRAVPADVARLGDVLSRWQLERRELSSRAIPDGGLKDIAIPDEHRELASVGRPSHAAHGALVGKTACRCPVRASTDHRRTGVGCT